MKVIHATKRALAYLQGGHAATFDVPRETNACDLAVTDGSAVGVLSVEEAKGTLPTCPVCLVLWDMALERAAPQGKAPTTR